MGKFLMLILTLGLILPLAAYAAMSSTNYYIYADSIDAGGVFGTSSLYSLHSVIGETGVGTVSSTSYEIRGGYLAMDRGYLSLDLTSNSINLGDLNTTTVSAASTTATISTDAVNGYGLSVASAVWNGASLADVTVPIFVAGTEAYGMVTSTIGGSDSDAFSIINNRLINTNVNPAINDRVVLTVKAAIGSATAAATYRQNITLQLMANF